MDLRPPCQNDHERTGREWADEAPPLTAKEIREMATMCKSCPFRTPCGELADRDPVRTVGVWAGQFYRRATRNPVDPLDVSDDRKSVFDSLTWEPRRESWKAWAQVEGHFHHIGQSEDEDEAYRLVLSWWEQQEGVA